jgi:hypothetical protein
LFDPGQLVFQGGMPKLPRFLAKPFWQHLSKGWSDQLFLCWGSGALKNAPFFCAKFFIAAMHIDLDQSFRGAV